MAADAVTVWSAELARDPRSLAFLSLGDELRRRGQLEDARQIALRGLERHPYLAAAHDLLARVYLDGGEEGKAHDEWAMALQLEPDHLPSLKGMGFLAYRRRDLAGAERHLRAAHQRDPRDAGVERALRRVQGTLALAPEESPARRPRPDEGLRLAPGANGNGHLANGHHPDVTRPMGAPEQASAAAPGAATAGASSPAERARMLFAPLLGDGDRTALLLDRDGLVLAGAYVDEQGRDIAADVGAELSGIGDEAARALAHLGLGAWQAILVEAQHATIALAPVGESATVLVAAARDTQVGFVRRLVERARARSSAWLERFS